MGLNRYSSAFVVSSACSSGACVEVARLGQDRIAVRDSKSADQPPHIFTDSEWVAFVQGVKAGEFDLGDVAG
jgi:hypothetical protein